MRLGRKPSLEITDEILDEIEKMAGNGLTQKQIAAFYHITPVTFIKMKKKDPRIMRVYKAGKSKAINEVSGILMEQIRSGNVPSIFFYLKTQAGWREKSTLKINSNIKSDNPVLKIETTDPIEASKIYQSIMTGSYNNERNSSSK